MMGIALLQNGQLPTILPLDIIEPLTEAKFGYVCFQPSERAEQVWIDKDLPEQSSTSSLSETQ